MDGWTGELDGVWVMDREIQSGSQSMHGFYKVNLKFKVVTV
jgi:hypothetical protein